MHRLCILIIDEDQGILDSFEEIFNEKYRVLTANGPEDGLDKIAVHKPFLVFLDLMMAGMRGALVLKEIGLRRLPTFVVATSTAFNLAYKNMALSQGAFHYLVKPLDVFEVEKVVFSLVN